MSRAGAARSRRFASSAGPGQAHLPGEEETGGVMAGIDAVGFQARDRRHPNREDHRQVIDDLARLVNPTGRLDVAGVFTATDAPHDDSASQDLTPLDQGRFSSPRVGSKRQSANLGLGPPGQVDVERGDS